jgi:hypothetical protein
MVFRYIQIYFTTSKHHLWWNGVATSPITYSQNWIKTSQLVGYIRINISPLYPHKRVSLHLHILHMVRSNPSFRFPEGLARQTFSTNEETTWNYPITHETEGKTLLLADPPPPRKAKSSVERSAARFADTIRALHLLLLSKSKIRSFSTPQFFHTESCE